MLNKSLLIDINSSTPAYEFFRVPAQLEVAEPLPSTPEAMPQTLILSLRPANVFDTVRLARGNPRAVLNETQVMYRLTPIEPNRFQAERI
jgi:hypothetical protein